jgi:hypothetical protein
MQGKLALVVVLAVHQASIPVVTNTVEGNICA